MRYTTSAPLTFHVINVDKPRVMIAGLAPNELMLGNGFNTNVALGDGVRVGNGRMDGVSLGALSAVGVAPSVAVACAPPPIVNCHAREVSLPFKFLTRTKTMC